MMTDEETVRALKWLAKVRTYCDTHMVICAECEFHGFCTDPDSDESIGEQAGWMKQAADLIESLQAQLAESQRREQAAVEDLKSANLCRHCGLNASCGSEIRSNRRAFGVCKRWEYRGPQEAGKGEAE